MKIEKFVSKSNPKLKYFVEPVTDNGSSVSYAVVYQVDGYPATEAHDDWFANYADARLMAAELAQNS